MSEVTIKYTQRVMGREIGAVERVERTELVDGLIKNNRVTVLVDHAAAEELFEMLAEEAEAASFPTDLPGAVSVEQLEVLEEATKSATVRRARKAVDEA